MVDVTRVKVSHEAPLIQCFSEIIRSDRKVGIKQEINIGNDNASYSDIEYLSNGLKMGCVMKLIIRKWGNSAGVLLPVEMLEQLKAKIGDKLNVNFTDHKAVIELAKPKYSLSALLAQCDMKAPVPADVKDWENNSLMGNEMKEL